MNAATADAAYWGLKVGEWVNIVGLIIGPVIAVLITLWIDGRRRSREQKIVVLRLLLATRHTPADPNFATAINLVPVEFAGASGVLQAHKEFVQAVNVKATPETEQAVAMNTGMKTTRLIYEVAGNLGFNIRETDIQSEAYASTGWTQRDALAQDSQKAMRDIANILAMQTRLLANIPLTDEQKQQLGITKSGN